MSFMVKEYASVFIFIRLLMLCQDLDQVGNYLVFSSEVGNLVSTKRLFL